MSPCGFYNPCMRYSCKSLIFLALTALLAACAANWPTAPLTAGAKAPAPETGRQVAGLAEGLLGVPYRYGGETPQGFDCSGLVQYVYGQVGERVPRTADAQFEAAHNVPVRALAPGDLVFFRLAGSKVSHVGIFVGGGRFIHAPSSGGQVSYARLADPWWWNRFIGAGRLYTP